MRAEALDRQLSIIALLELVPRTQPGKGLKTPQTPIEGLHLQLAEAVRVRDLAQEMAYAQGANISLAQKKIAAVGLLIDCLQSQLDTAMASDLASSAIAAAKSHFEGAIAHMYEMTPEQIARAQDPASDQDEHDDSLAREWLDYWASLSVEERRTLLLALDVKPKLMLLGQGKFDFRLTWDLHSNGAETV